MSDIFRIAAVARLDPNADQELAAWRGDLGRGIIDDPSETRARLDAYGRGDSVIACLDLFALTCDEDRVVRYPAGSIPGCWFEVGSDRQNLSHAREMVANNLELVRDQVRNQGIDASLSTLERADVAVELDELLTAKLSRG